MPIFLIFSSESEDGAISFNSDKHYAWYPLQTGGGDFIVYDGTYTVRGKWSSDSCRLRSF